jgi:hypothetical protein
MQEHHLVTVRNWGLLERRGDWLIAQAAGMAKWPVMSEYENDLPSAGWWEGGFDEVPWLTAGSAARKILILRH